MTFLMWDRWPIAMRGLELRTTGPGASSTVSLRYSFQSPETLTLPTPCMGYIGSMGSVTSLLA